MSTGARANAGHEIRHLQTAGEYVVRNLVDHQCDFPRAYAKSMLYQLAGRALEGRVPTQLIGISVSLGGDKLNVTLLYASASQAAFSLGNFKVS